MVGLVKINRMKWSIYMKLVHIYNNFFTERQVVAEVVHGNLNGSVQKHCDDKGLVFYI